MVCNSEMREVKCILAIVGLVTIVALGVTSVTSLTVRSWNSCYNAYVNSEAVYNFKFLQVRISWKFYCSVCLFKR